MTTNDSNKPADVFVIDDQHPEDIAMLQALYSRSPASVTTHLEKLANSGSGKFMDQYYVGYGHASIGDCGSTTCFIEQVSMLVAKAIQDSPLYNGQEASTRYLDFSKQSIHDPYNHPKSAGIQHGWMDLYNDTLPKVIAGLEIKHPFDSTQYKSETVWQNTLKARAFDICRSLLPIGTTTLLSWSTSLRAARDHLRRLKHHPLPEVRRVVQTLFTQLRTQYPNSFREDDSKIDESSEREQYAKKFALKNHYLTFEDINQKYNLAPAVIDELRSGQIFVNSEAIDLNSLQENEIDVLNTRPKNSPLPWRLESYGRYNFCFLLDFGSFRDIQRHRNGVCQSPLVDDTFGIHPWYTKQLGELLSITDFNHLLCRITQLSLMTYNLSGEGIVRSQVLDQYLYPMGYMAIVHCSYSVPETVYVGELRSQQTVHPTLRPIAQLMLKILKNHMPEMSIYGDFEEDTWSAMRGEQTITSKEEITDTPINISR